jgi:hypothetical protein
VHRARLGQLDPKFPQLLFRCHALSPPRSNVRKPD